MGGTDDISNIIALTPEEHFVAHQLLIKIHPDNHKLIYAARMMCVSNGKNKRNNKSYAWLKKKVVEKLPRKKRKQELTPRKKRVLTEDHKKKIALSRIGFKHSDETKERIKHTNTGSNLGRIHKIVECPHCGKCGGQNVMHLHHFSNCKIIQ